MGHIEEGEIFFFFFFYFINGLVRSLTFGEMPLNTVFLTAKNKKRIWTTTLQYQEEDVILFEFAITDSRKLVTSATSKYLS